MTINEPILYSIRMHATREGKHASGAERIVQSGNIDVVVHELNDRALGRGCTQDQISITIEPIEKPISYCLTALDVTTLAVYDHASARFQAGLVLQREGVSRLAIQAAIDHISRGASQTNENMRGAMIMDARTGVRLEYNPDRGVRTSKFDWLDSAREAVDRMLNQFGLTHFRTREALALATKVAHGPGIVAELCWSDEPDYTAGYAASIHAGYVRFPVLKKPGDAKGGRAFFVDRDKLDLDTLIYYLEKEPVLITHIGSCNLPMLPEQYFERNI